MTLATELPEALPEIAPAYHALQEALWQQGHIPAQVLELCRLRLAQLHASTIELQRQCCELPEGKRTSVANWHSGESFTPAEKACLAFAEVYAMDAAAISDEQADAVKSHFGEPGLVLLIEALGILDGRIRIGLLWQSLRQGVEVAS